MINHFKGEYSWLSNFTACKIKYGELIFNSVELFYIAMKIVDDPLKRREISNSSAFEAGQWKKASKEWKLRGDWEDIKLDVMEYALRQKFSQEPFKSKLKATDNENIQEGNYWNDTFWGVDLKQTPNYGENHLGRIIMKIRDEL